MNPTFEEQKLAHRLSLDALAREWESRSPANSYQIEETLRRGIAFHQDHFGEVYLWHHPVQMSLEQMRASGEGVVAE